LSLARLHSTIRDLPYGLREQIIGFATYIDDASDDLLDLAGITEPSRNQIDELVYIAGLWRLWQIINSLFSLLDNSLSLLQSNNLTGATLGDSDIGYRMGGQLYSRTSTQYSMLAGLRADLSATLISQQLGFVPAARNIADLVRGVVSQSGF
jgi:hypothetical protein